MLGIKNKKLTKPIHEIPVNEWETALDQIYRKVVGGHASALAIVSNTKREKNDDKEGSVSEATSFLFKRESDTGFISIKQADHQAIKSIDKDIFNGIFTTYLKLDESKKFDFSHVGEKNGLEKDFMIYPLHKGLEKKAFIVFEFPLDQEITKMVSKEILVIFAGKYSK